MEATAGFEGRTHSCGSALTKLDPAAEHLARDDAARFRPRGYIVLNCSHFIAEVHEWKPSIATITPVEAPADVDWAHQLVAEGHAHWNGGKPTGAKRPPKLTGKTASSIVLEDRR